MPNKPKRDPMKSTREQIGVVGVDSGQLIICDPMYIGSEWKPTAQLCVGKIFLDPKTGLTWGCDLHHRDGVRVDRRFHRFDSKIAEYGNRPANQLIEDGTWQERPRPESKEFSYQGCCDATLSEKMYGQLNFERGHEGAAVAFSSGWGDGVYPVFAYRNEEGRIIKVVIEMG